MGKHHDTDAQTSGVAGFSTAEMMVMVTALDVARTYYEGQELFGMAEKITAITNTITDAVQWGNGATITEAIATVVPLFTGPDARELALDLSMARHPAGSQL